MNRYTSQPTRKKDGVISRMLTQFMVSMWVLAAPLVMAQAPAVAPASDAWKTKPAASTGLAVGEKVPAFELRDQNGKLQSFQSVRGPKGAAIYFMRSADW